MTQTSPKPDYQNSKPSSSAANSFSVTEPTSTSNVASSPFSSVEQATSEAQIIQPLELTTKGTKQQGKKRSLRNQLLLYVLPTLLLPMVVAGAIGYGMIQKDAEARVKMQLRNQTLLASQAASNLLKEAFKFPEMVASNPIVIEAARLGSKQVEAEKLVQLTDEQLEARFVKYKLLKPNQQLNDYLRKLVKLNKVPEIFITERYGLNIAYNQITTDFVQNDEDWWIKASQAKRWVSSPRANESVGLITIDLAQAIIDPQTEEFLGVIKYALPTNKFNLVSNYLMRTGIEGSQTQKVQIIDRQGGVIVTVSGVSGSSQETNVIGDQTVLGIADTLLKVIQDNNISKEEEIKKTIDEEIKKKIRDLNQKSPPKQVKFGRSAVVNREADEPSLIVSFSTVNTLYKMATVSGTNWVAVASIEQAEISSTANDLLIVFVLAALFLGIPGVGVALILARKLSNPLGKLAQTAEKIASGNLDVRAEPEGTKETETLAQSFNNLVVQLKSLLRQQAFETKQSRLLAEISNSVTMNKQDGERVLAQSLEGARQILEVERIVIYRFQPNGSGYIAHESVIEDWPVGLNYQIEDACISQALLEEYLQGRVVATNNVFEANLHPEHLQLMEQLQVKANLVVPILNQGQLYGLLVAHHCAATHEWQEREINFMKQLTAQLGLLLDRVAFIEERQQEAKRSERIKEITLKISGALKAEDILETAVRESRQVLGTDRVMIDSFDGIRKGTVIAESVGENWAPALGAEITDPGFINQFIEQYKKAQVMAISDIYKKSNLDEFHLKQLEPFGVRAKLVTPILMGGELRGLLIGHQCSGPRNWEQADIDFLSQVATQVGLALERANLLEQQRDAREYLQERALELLREVDPVSKGDLTIRARVTEDEIGTVAYSYNATIESLQKIVNQVQAASRQVTTTTDQNQTSVQGLSSGALRQRREIEAAKRQIQAMADSITAVAANAEQAETMVQQATQTVEAGEVAMNRTVEGIMAICDTVAETAEKVKQLGESSQKISKVVNLISRFAAQTNLLALKTSIEAARAGEEGRGFAVIADEIRSLAAQSAEATAEIKKLIAAIQTETNEVVAAMEAGTSQVIDGTKLVDETRSSLDKIASVSAQINQLVKEIATAALEQAEASDAVNKRIAEVAAISNQTSTEAEQVADSFQELLAVAEALQESVGQFKVA
ncbi:MAG: methyl-accepting chemotaxis protein [Prochloraceae cyanobacterium]